jgi:hypothetical protein
MPTYVLTYNPQKWDWPAGDRSDGVARTAGGETVPGRWSTGVRTSEIAPGDTAVLLRQGQGHRGLIGRGKFASEVYQDEHWDGSGRDANYADLEWDLLLEDHDLIPLADVAAAVTTVNWSNIQGSGIVVPFPGDVALDRLWGEVAGVGPGDGRGGKKQGWQSDAVRRKAVEDYAQRLLERKYRDDGWAVADTRYGKPYDAVATKGNSTRYLEAKGTETDGRSVLVTVGEVRWAEQHPDECVLGVVSGIRFDPEDQLDEASGTLTEYTWDPSTGLLRPQTFTWTPPAP